MLGITSADPFPDVATTMRGRIEDGSSARLTFTYKDPDKATRPHRSFPSASSIVVVALPYLGDGDGASAGRVAGRQRSVARFADGDRYAALSSLLEDIASSLVGAGWEAEPVVDDDRLVDRAAAVRAGIGWWGKSTMVLTPGMGPWVLIGSVVTDAPLPRGVPMRRTCGTCDACIPACPTDAIIAPGVLDARRCLAAIFQSRADIPRDVRKAAGGRIYGCDDCLTACPPGSRALAQVAPTDRMLTPVDVLTMDDEELERITSHWYVPGRKMRFVRRNALVAIGNTGGPADIPTIMAYVEHEDDMLVRHALWALGQIDPEGAAHVAGRRGATARHDATLHESAHALRRRGRRDGLR